MHEEKISTVIHNDVLLLVCMYASLKLYGIFRRCCQRSKGEGVNIEKCSLDLPPERIGLLAGQVRVPCKLIGSPVTFSHFRQA
jgi:hypothetical protein